MPTYPHININGTSKEQLMDALKNAYQSVTDAIDAVGKTSPHGRDYQTLPSGAWMKARDEYEERMRKIVEVRNEIIEIAMNVDRQGN